MKIQDGGHVVANLYHVTCQCSEHSPCSVVGETRTLTKPSLERRLERRLERTCLFWSGTAVLPDFVIPHHFTGELLIRCAVYKFSRDYFGRGPVRTYVIRSQS